MIRPPPRSTPFPYPTPFRSQQAPEKDVRVQEQLHRREASHSCSGMAGERMSPVIFPVLLREPSQDSGLFGGGGGMICAIGGRKRTRLNSSPGYISYAAFCL